MVLDEGVDEEVRVGVPLLHPQLHGDVAVGDAGLHEIFREQLLLFVELIVAALYIIIENIKTDYTTLLTAKYKINHNSKTKNHTVWRSPPPNYCLFFKISAGS